MKIQIQSNTDYPKTFTHLTFKIKSTEEIEFENEYRLLKKTKKQISESAKKLKNGFKIVVSS